MHHQPHPTAASDDQYRTDANLTSRITLHQRFSVNAIGWFRWLFDRLDLPAEARLLELGCGRGDLWFDNRDRLPTSWRLVLTDRSASMATVSRRQLAASAVEVTIGVVDARSLPFAPAAFDAVVANHMLYHVPDRPAALAEIRRVLRSGGRLYAATNGRDHLRELDDLVRSVAPEAPGDDVAATFGLETGAAQLAARFGKVVRHDYPDALAVTEVAPVVAYLLSTAAAPLLDRPRLQRLRMTVAEAIARDGAFRITKSTGVLIAR